MMPNDVSPIKKESSGTWRPRMDVSRPPRVLLIDDDIDAIIPIQNILLELGISGYIVSDPNEVKKALCSRSWDLIVLDWLLDISMTGSQVVRQADRFMGKIKNLDMERAAHPSPIISYSVLPGSEVLVPHSEHFFHLDHWKKPFGYAQLRSKIYRVIPQIKQRGGV